MIAPLHLSRPDPMALLALVVVGLPLAGAAQGVVAGVVSLPVGGPGPLDPDRIGGRGRYLAASAAVGATTAVLGFVVWITATSSVDATLRAVHPVLEWTVPQVLATAAVGAALLSADWDAGRPRTGIAGSVAFLGTLVVTGSGLAVVVLG